MQVVIRPNVEKCEQENNTRRIKMLTGGDDTLNPFTLRVLLKKKKKYCSAV
jgi:hypothetical protein